MNKKVTIILIHYNQPKYVKIALDSIFEQDYKNIELIFADDCSKEIDVADLKKYCSKKNKKNIKVIWQINKQNLGTVKNVNRSVQKSSGDYILIFAADDKLYDEHVISKLVNSFSKQTKDTAIVSGQCFMMDNNLEKEKYKFVNYIDGEKFNKKTPIEQYKVLTQKCFLAMGACMIDADILKKEGLFSEKYKFIEDWYIFLALTQKNYKLIFDGSINALLHRDGGISHNHEINSIDSPIVGFRKDLIDIFINEVLPNFNILNYSEKCNVYELLINNIKNYEELGLTISNFNKNDFRIKNAPFFIHRKISYININYNTIKNKFCNNLSVINTLLIIMFLINKSQFKIVLYLLIILLSINMLGMIFLYIIRFLYKIRIIKDR